MRRCRLVGGSLDRRCWTTVSLTLRVWTGRERVAAQAQLRGRSGAMLGVADKGPCRTAGTGTFPCMSPRSPAPLVVLRVAPPQQQDTQRLRSSGATLHLPPFPPPPPTLFRPPTPPHHAALCRRRAGYLGRDCKRMQERERRRAGQRRAGTLRPALVEQQVLEPKLRFRLALLHLPLPPPLPPLLSLMPPLLWPVLVMGHERVVPASRMTGGGALAKLPTLHSPTARGGRHQLLSCSCGTVGQLHGRRSRRQGGSLDRMPGSTALPGLRTVEQLPRGAVAQRDPHEGGAS